MSGSRLWEQVGQVARQEKNIRRVEGLGGVVLFAGLAALVASPAGYPGILAAFLLAFLGLVPIVRSIRESPTPLECARILDRRLALEERLSTALEWERLPREMAASAGPSRDLLVREAVRALQDVGEPFWRSSPRLWKIPFGMACLVLAIHLARSPLGMATTPETDPVPTEARPLSGEVAVGQKKSPEDDSPRGIRGTRGDRQQSLPPGSPPVKPLPRSGAGEQRSTENRRSSPPKAKRVGDRLFEEEQRRPGSLFRRSIPSLFGEGDPARLKARVRESMPGDGDEPGSDAGRPDSGSDRRYQKFRRLAEETVRSDRLGRSEREIVRRYFEAIRPR